MLCSQCLGLVFRAVIRTNQRCFTAPPYCLFSVLIIVTVYCGQINDDDDEQQQQQQYFNDDDDDDDNYNYDDDEVT